MKEEKEFESIYKDTHQTILNYVIVKCDNISNVEDIVQNVYIKVYKLLPKKGRQYFSIPILIKFCKNELFRYYKIKNKLKTIFYNDEVSYLIENLKSNINIENDIETKLEEEAAWNIIKNEDLETQKIASLYFINDMTIKNISNLMQLNENTVKSKLYRLINKLKGEWNINYEKK